MLGMGETPDIGESAGHHPPVVMTMAEYVWREDDRG